MALQVRDQVRFEGGDEEFPGPMDPYGPLWTTYGPHIEPPYTAAATAAMFTATAHCTGAASIL